MMSKPSRWVAVVVGAIATVACAAFGLLMLRERPHRGSWESGFDVAPLAEPARETRRVTLDPTGLRYYEGENSLELTVEMASDRRGAYYIVYIWTARSWVKEMPEWCRYRRDEIFSEIKRLTADRRIQWVEEE